MAARKTRSRVRRPVTRRTTTRRASNGGNVWSREEVAFMRKYYKNNETAWCARQLGRTVYSVRYKASDLSIKKASPSVWRGSTGSTVARKTTRRAVTRKNVSRKASTKRTVRKTRMNKTRVRRATSKRMTTRKASSRRIVRRRTR